MSRQYPKIDHVPDLRAKGWTPPAPPKIPAGFLLRCNTVVGLEHLREPGAAGYRDTGGGTDTPSLCGRVTGGPRVLDVGVFDPNGPAFTGCTDCAGIALAKCGHRARQEGEVMHYHVACEAVRFREAKGELTKEEADREITDIIEKYQTAQNLRAQQEAAANAAEALEGRLRFVWDVAYATVMGSELTRNALEFRGRFRAGGMSIATRGEAREEVETTYRLEDPAQDHAIWCADFTVKRMREYLAKKENDHGK